MISVIKSTGDKEEYDKNKIFNSIKRAKIPGQLETQIIENVQNKLYDSIPTSEIYKRVTNYLSTSPYPYAKTKYALKESIMSLGPTGYPFEEYVGEILKSEGYTVKLRSILRGKCIQHEIDLIAERDQEKIMVEVKFHNQFGTRTDVQDALYTKARFDDIKENNKFSGVWLVTNTKITSDVITYGLCMGMKITSWNYPDKESLRNSVEKFGLFPVTALSSLSKQQKEMLLENHIVLCKNLCRNPEILESIGIDKLRQTEVLNEAEFVCNLIKS